MSDISCKALNVPTRSSKIKSYYHDFTFWFYNKIWYNYAPDFMISAWRTLSNFWHNQVTCRIFPRQKWLTKQIRRDWQDKVSLMVDIPYAMVVHFVEVEKCFEVTNWPNSGLAEQEKQLKEIYDWIKVGRPAMRAKLMAAFPPLNDKDFEDLYTWLNRKDPVREACYENVRKIEAEIEEWDTRCLVWLAQNRMHFWT